MITTCWPEIASESRRSGSRTWRRTNHERGELSRPGRGREIREASATAQTMHRTRKLLAAGAALR